MKLYDVGDLVRVSVDFKNLAGALADPSAITFKVRKPDQTVVIYVYGTDGELVKDAAGQYHVDVLLDQSGVYSPRFIGTGAVSASTSPVVFTARTPFV